MVIVFMFGLSHVGFAELMSVVLTRLVAYFIVIPLPGVFRAWVSKKMGDSTAAEHGLTQLDPFVQVDIFGFICMLMFGFGWGRRIPLDPSRIYNHYRGLRLFVASFSAAFVFILQAVVIFIMLFVNRQLFEGMEMSSFSVSLEKILGQSATLCIFLAAIEIIINGIYLAGIYLVEKQGVDRQQLWFGSLVATFVMLIFFGGILQAWIVTVINFIVSLMFSLIS